MENNPLRGIGKLGWTEAGKMHSTNKRLIGTIDNENFHKDKSKQVKVACDKCGSVFSIRGEKLPNHKITYSTSVKNETTDKWENVMVTETCNGNLVKPGKVKIDEYKYSFIRHTKPYTATAVEVIVKPGDTVVAELKHYNNGELTTSIVEKTIKYIVKTTTIKNWYNSLPKITINIICTDGTELPLYVKDIYII